MYINNQQINNSNGLYAQNFYFCNNFKGAISEYKEVLHFEVYDFEECPDEITDAPLSEPFFALRMKMPSRPDGFMLCGKLGVEVFSTSDLLYPNMKIRLSQIRSGPILYMVIDSSNDSLEIANCSLYRRRIALTDDYNKKKMAMLA